VTSNEIIKLIEAQAGQVTSKIITDIIADQSTEKTRMMRLYNAYNQVSTAVPILSRTFEDENKINEKLAHDFRGDIVDTAVGYLWGKPVTYGIKADNYNEATLNKITQEIELFKLRNNLEDLDSHTGKMMTVCGKAARLLYVDKNGEIRVMNINPWEAIFVKDATLDQTQYAMIYYPVTTVIDGQSKILTRVEWYDKTNVSFWISSEGGAYIPDTIMTENGNTTIPHMFDFIPLIEYVNNDSNKGDFEKVESLIDAYDILESDVQNELEELRLAYMIFTGAEATAEVIKQARQTGAFSMPEGTSVSFLTKSLSDTIIENHKKTIAENIYKFSKSVDMSDEKFSGQGQSGESRKWKLVGLENKCISKERKFVKASREMFQVLCSAWNKKQIPLVYTDVQITLNRNLPVELSYLKDVVTGLTGLVPKKILLGLLPFIPNVETALSMLEEEQGMGFTFANNNTQTETTDGATE